MWPRPRRAVTAAGPEALADAVERLLCSSSAAPSGREVTRAANDWAQCAVGTGVLPSDVDQQLELWSARFAERSPAALVRVGRRLHPGAQLRLR